MASGGLYVTKVEAIRAWNTRHPLYIVVCYNAQSQRGVLAIKATRAEAERVQARWAEIVEGSDIEEWQVGQELEPEA